MKTLLLLLNFSALIFSQKFESTKWDTIYTGLYFNDIIKLNSDTLIAATGSGIFSSTNYGENWTQNSNQILTNLVLDNNQLIYGTYSQNIFISNDSGVEWTLVNFVLNQGYITKLEVDNNNNLWAITNSPAKLFKSTDSGLNWALMYSTNFDIADIDFDRLNNIYLLTMGRCMKSTDDGINWTVFFDPPIFQDLRQTEINPNDEIYFISHQVIFHTINYGLNWRTLSGIQCQLIKSFDKNNMLIYEDRVYKSSDGGNYWFNIGLDLYEPGLTVQIYCIDSLILASYYDILSRYNPHSEPPVYTIKENYLPLSVGNKWLYKGGNWAPPYSNSFLKNMEATSEQLIGGRKYVYITGLGWLSYSDEDKLFFIYQDGYEIPLMDFKLPDYTLYPIYSPQNQDDLFYHKIHSGYVYQTNIHTKGYSFPYFEGIISHSFAENLGQYSFSDIGTYGNGGYYLIQALILDSLGTQQLYDYPHNPQIVFAPITKTSDTLLTFTLTVNHHFSVDTSNYILQGLNFIDSVLMSGFYIFEDDTLPFNTIYAENIYGTKNFVFNVPIDINLLSSNYKLNYRITAKDKGIVAHWDYKPSDSSFYQMILDTTLSVEDQTSQFITFKLYQNFPNPFNPSTVISYQLPTAGDITLKVYDVLGREVAILVDEYKEAGYHKVEFLPESPIGAGSIKNPASGVYFYQLRAGDYSETKKMILLR